MTRRLVRLTFNNAIVALALFALAPLRASATTFNFTGTFSDTSVNVPVDLDSNNCSPVNGLTTCPADSAVSTGGGTRRSAGPENGPNTFQTVAETVFVPGTGCSFAP